MEYRRNPARPWRPLSKGIWLASRRGQKDVDSAVVRHLQMIQAVLRNIRGMVGEAIDLRVDLLEIDASQFLIH